MNQLISCQVILVSMLYKEQMGLGKDDQNGVRERVLQGFAFMDPTKKCSLK